MLLVVTLALLIASFDAVREYIHEDDTSELAVSSQNPFLIASVVRNNRARRGANSGRPSLFFGTRPGSHGFDSPSVGHYSHRNHVSQQDGAKLMLDCIGLLVVAEEGCDQVCGGGTQMWVLDASNPEAEKCRQNRDQFEGIRACNMNPCPEQMIKVQAGRIPRAGRIDLRESSFKVDKEHSQYGYECQVHIISEKYQSESTLVINADTGKVDEHEGNLFVEPGDVIAWEGCELQMKQPNEEFTKLRDEQAKELLEMDMRLLGVGGEEMPQLNVNSVDFDYNLVIMDAPPQEFRVYKHAGDWHNAHSVVLEVIPLRWGSHEIDSVRVTRTCQGEVGPTEVNYPIMQLPAEDCDADSRCPHGKKYHVKVSKLLPGKSCTFKVQLRSSAGISEPTELELPMPFQGCQSNGLLDQKKCCKGPDTDFDGEFSYRCEDLNLFGKTCSKLGPGWSGAKNLEGKNDINLCSYWGPR